MVGRARLGKIDGKAARSGQRSVATGDGRRAHVEGDGAQMRRERRTRRGAAGRLRCCKQTEGHRPRRPRELGEPALAVRRHRRAPAMARDTSAGRGTKRSPRRAPDSTSTTVP